MESKRQVVDTNKKTNDINEDMVIESSEKLEVIKSFDDMGLREELLRGNIKNQLTLNRNLRIWVQQTIRSIIESYSSYHKGQRCNCAKSKWYW